MGQFLRISSPSSVCPLMPTTVTPPTCRVLVIIFIGIRMHGATSNGVAVVGDLGTIWGANGAVWLVLKVQAWWKKKKVA
jgi:hypothetical protein